MAGGLPRVLRDQFLQLELGAFVLLVRYLRAPEGYRQFRPAVGRAHVDGSNRLQPRPWRLDPEQTRGFAALHAAPELLLRGDQKVRYSGSAWIVSSTHLPPPVMTDSTAVLWLVTHILC
jgi:hypothetical protein